MKKILIIILGLVATLNINAQETSSGFDANKLFAGGSVILGLGFGNNSVFRIGANPEFGYSIAKNFDIGICGNIIYSSTRYQEIDNYGYYTGNNIKQITTNYGVGAFARLHLTDRIFIQAQPEANTIKYKAYVVEAPDYKQEGKLSSTSFLVGAGYGSRDVGNFNYFTVILIDLRKDLYSPYRDGYGNIIPIIRGGFNFYFGRHKKK